ncbi:Tyrosine-protein kinase receptor Tie-1 [Holothuria leucospilota]|uniref:Tyrosine-protein kinase receptor Tie-1 n=1 Tax=Holothuria leucospilota TaxID=206669 RepID=A0A9Q1H002_HOLLE|nr:Tyrosine-protein kinase receptor Tie-1 [Holothuria leucospilota]
MATSLPQLGRNEGPLYIYALDSTGLYDPGEFVEIEKDGGIPRNLVATGTVVNDNVIWGCYLEVHVPNRYKGIRYGTYEGTLNDDDQSHIFVNPETKILNLRGVHTVTLYPKTTDPDETEFTPSEPIGVAWTPGCFRIRWCKGRKLVNIGPKLKLPLREAAGIYTIQRNGRGKRGWSVQLEVIVASCPFGRYQDTPSTCAIRTRMCINGGVGKDSSDSCLCPSPYGGIECEENLESGYTGLLAQYEQSSIEGRLRCSDLKGGNAKCKGFLLCYGDLFGCKCAPGWHGNSCERPCPIGRWGIDCSQVCPASDPKCDRFRGPSNPGSPG